MPVMGICPREFISESNSRVRVACPMEALEERVKQLEEENGKLLNALAKRGKQQSKFGETNPLLLPANQYNRTLVEINQPFMTFIRKSPFCDKARKCRMRKSVLQHAVHETLLRPMVKLENTHKRAVTELNYRPWHLSQLWGFKDLTRPSREARAEVETLEREATFYEADETEVDETEEEEEDCSDDDFVPEDMNLEEGQVEDDADAHEDDDAEPADDNASAGSGVSRQSMDIGNEFKKSDIRVKVLDRHVWKNGEDGWVTVLIIEGKEPWNENAIYQAIKYEYDQGLVNLGLGRVAPIHAMVFSSGVWTYAVVDIFGAVTLEQGAITAESMTEFLEHQKLRWKYMGKPDDTFAVAAKYSVENLKAKLETRKKLMRKNCSSDRAIDYPDGSYLVGEIYVKDRKRNLPNARSRASVLHPDAFLFYESLLRIIVGDSVLRWTSADVDQALATRKALEDKQVDCLAGKKRPREEGSN